MITGREKFVIAKNLFLYGENEWLQNPVALVSFLTLYTLKCRQHRVATYRNHSIMSWNHGLEPLTFFLKEITFPRVSFSPCFYSPSLSPGFLLTLHSCLHIQTSDRVFTL